VIGEAIRKPGERGSGGAADAFVPAVAYICNKACEIVLRNFMSTNWRYAAADMMRTAEINSRVQRPFYHLVLSWHPDERPKPEDQIAAMEMMLERLGLEEHQAVVGVHDDCDHLHVHAAINTVHPLSGKVWSKKHDHARIENACRAIEHHFGWPHDKGRFDVTITNTGDVELRPAPDRWQQKEAARKSGSRKPTRADIAFEKEHGLPGFAQSIPDGLRTRFGDIATKAESWADLHEALAGIGLVYLRKGSGAAIGIIGSAETGKAAAFGQAFTFSRMQKRLGTYIGPIEGPRSAKTPDVVTAETTVMRNSLEAVFLPTCAALSDTKAASFKLTLLRRTYTGLFLEETVSAQIKYVNLHAEPPFITFKSGGNVVDLGSRITTTAKGDDAIRLMVAMAKAKGWSAVKPSGNPTFVRQAAIIAAEAGLPVFDVPADIQELADRILIKVTQTQKTQISDSPTSNLKPDAPHDQLATENARVSSQVTANEPHLARSDKKAVSEIAANNQAAPEVPFAAGGGTDGRQPTAVKPSIKNEKSAPSGHAMLASIWKEASAVDPAKPNLATAMGISAATLQRFGEDIRIGAYGALMFARRDPRSGGVQGIQRENSNGQVATRGRADIATLGNPETAKRVVIVASGLNALALAEIENDAKTLYVSVTGPIDDQTGRDLKWLCKGRSAYDARQPASTDQHRAHDIRDIVPKLMDLSVAYFGIDPVSPGDTWVDVLKLVQADRALADKTTPRDEEPASSNVDFGLP